MTSYRFWLGAMLLLVTGPMQVMHLAVAQSLGALPDPTRPPPGLMPAPPAQPGAVAATASSASAPSESSASRVNSAPWLTMVRVDAQTGKGVAVIGGRLVSVGDRVGQAVVSAIDTQGVTLRTNKGSRRLSLWNPSQQAFETSAAVADSEKESP